MQWGVALQSWALWLARGLGLAFTGYAADGATVTDVVQRQIPLFLSASAAPAARYDVGCLYIGANDVRALDWDASRFRARFAQAAEFLTERCDRVLVATIPLDLGRPPAGAKIGEANEVILGATAGGEDAADGHAAGGVGGRVLLLDLRDFGARNLVMTDHVHPTAFGQITIAERALELLRHDGMDVRLSPRSLIYFETTWWKRLRGDATYLYRHAKVSAKAAVDVWRARRTA